MDSRHAPSTDEALAQTLHAISSVPVSQGDFSDLCYSPELTRRIADRALRDSFEQAFRYVPAARPMRSAPDANRRSRAACYPPLRGADADDIELESQYASVAREVGPLLARQGLVHAACHSIRAVGLPADRSTQVLLNVGIPVDLLAHVMGQSRDSKGQDAAATLVHVACAVTPSTEEARDRLLRETNPRPWLSAVPGATLRSDAGDAGHSAAVISLAREDFLFGPGDGGALDHARACVDAMGPTPLIVLACDPNRARTLLNAPHAHVVPCQAAPAQFIRDAACVLQHDSTSSLLLPRFPSRGEIGTMHAPDLLPCEERDLASALKAINPASTLVRSSLHFHGGDILCWHDADGAHALIGEGTIARNTAMGLSEAQVRDAFQRELNAVELVVLPAATFHVDTCISILRTAQGPTFLVADPMAAASLIIEEGCERLRRERVLTPASARQITGSLARRNEPSNAIASELLARALAYFSVPGAMSLSSLLAPTDPDGGSASAMRFLHAADILAAASGPLSVNAHMRAYLDSLRRALTDLGALTDRLAPRGRIVPLAAGITGPAATPAANMVHLGDGTTLMPAFGGIGIRADSANQITLERGVNRRVTRIPASESAIRQGAIRCSLVLLG